MKFRSRLFSLCAGVAAAFLVASPHVAAQMVENGLIAFTAVIDGQSQIFTISTDGVNQHQLTYDPNGAYAPSWAPNGTHLAYWNERGISVIHADGTGVRLIPDTAGILDPVWSPDSTTLLATTQSQIILVDVNSGAQIPISIQEFPEQVFYQFVAWAPSGDQFVFSSSGVNFLPTAVDGNPSMDLYVASIDGSHVERIISQDLERFGSLNWTADNQIVFSATGVFDAHLVNAIFSYDLQSQQLNVLSNPALFSSGTAISSDQNEIAIIESNRDIVIMNRDGTSLTRLISFQENILALAWQPVLAEVGALPPT